jgi:hypothetical protein
MTSYIVKKHCSLQPGRKALYGRPLVADFWWPILYGRFCIGDFCRPTLYGRLLVADFCGAILYGRLLQADFCRPTFAGRLLQADFECGHVLPHENLNLFFNVIRIINEIEN